MTTGVDGTDVDASARHRRQQIDRHRCSGGRTAGGRRLAGGHDGLAGLRRTDALGCRRRGDLERRSRSRRHRCAGAAAATTINRTVGTVSALVCCHCESVDSEHPDHHGRELRPPLRRQRRATWLLIKAFAEQFAGPAGSGRIVAAHQRPHRVQPPVRRQQGSARSHRAGRRRRTRLARRHRQRRQPRRDRHRLDG